MNILVLEKFLNFNNNNKIKPFYEIQYNKNTRKNKVSVIFTRLNYKLDKNFLIKYPNLKIIVTPTTGINHLDLDYINKNNIKLINLLKFRKKIDKIYSTSQYTLSLILSASRRILEYSYLSKKGSLHRYHYKTFQFQKLTCGIIGYGRIGKYVSKNLKKLGFKVLIYEKYLNKKRIKNTKLSFVSLKKLLNFSDIISLNVNYIQSNKDFLNKKNLKFCLKKPILVNTSRGELINEKDLIYFIKKKIISSAYLDVFKNEQNPKKINKELLNMNKKGILHLLPHIGGATWDALIETENLVIESLLNEYN